MKARRKIRFSPGTIIMVLIMIVFLVPFAVMFLGSIKPNMALNVVPVDFSPFRNTTLSNFKTVFDSMNVGRAYLNSLFLLVFVVVGEVFLSVTAGYIFATKRFPLRRILFGLVIVTMMMPRQLLLVPNFMVAKKLKLIDSLTGVALTTINASYGIFLTRQFIMTIPRDFYEAARIDGAGETAIFARIVLPLIKPAMAAVAVSSMFSVWNDYLWQNIMLTSVENRTVPLMLAYLTNMTQNGIPVTGLQMAGSVIAAVPLLVFFIIFQRWFIEGISTGGIKE